MQIFNNLTYINKCSLALGYFDGLHFGHLAALKNAVKTAQKNNTQSAVITFSAHPLAYLSKNPPGQILTLDEKLEILERIGIDNAVILDFKEFSSMRAADYLENVIVKYFSPAAITTGFNHSFGFKKEGNSSFLRENQEKYGYKYYEIPPICIDGILVSCTYIRSLLSMGNFFEASRLLGGCFFVRGTVVRGDKLASKLGFPSANIIYPAEKIQIPYGVYYTRVKIEGEEYNAVLNHGFVPDAEHKMKLKTEAHIIGFNRDIYGSEIQISFIAKIRNQMNFENTEKLKAQILRDIAFTDIYGRFLNTAAKN